MVKLFNVQFKPIISFMFIIILIPVTIKSIVNYFSYSSSIMNFIFVKLHSVNPILYSLFNLYVDHFNHLIYFLE